ncbi:MAG: hypothetical protein WCI61_04955 [Chloroflexota bacterium]
MVETEQGTCLRLRGILDREIGSDLAALLMQPWFFAAVGLLSAGALVWLLYYSYAVWRTDPDRVPVTGTLPPREGR